VLPEHLRELLEKLGAKVSQRATNTHVYIPGADSEYAFERLPDGTTRVSSRAVGVKGFWEYDQPVTHDASNPERSIRAVGTMAEGQMEHEGSQHRIQLDQRLIGNQEDGYQLHRDGYVLHDLNDNNSNIYGLITRFPNENSSSDEHALLHGIFNQRPNHFWHPLIDCLSENHNLALPLKDEPHQYSRDLDDQYQREQEPMI
jgi:hypothetical protein